MVEDMSKITFTKTRMPAAHMGKASDYPILYTGKRFYKGSVMGEEEGLYLNFGGVQCGLPYTAQDSYDHTEQMREFDAAILENDCLRATFLPGVGGKLWSLYDKRRERELLASNPVFKPCNLAIRNAWTAGGVEFNCGVRGHNPLTCDKIFAAEGVGEDGEPFLRLYAFERIRAITYQMDFYLPEGSAFLLARMRLVNGADLPVPIYWWSNIAVPQEEGARILVPADKTYVNHKTDPVYIIDIPMVNGVDQSYPINHVETIDHFYRIPENSRKFEAHIRRDGTGIIHASTRRLKGRKMFVWGMSVGGQNWQRFLTNKDGQPYVEIQAGLAYTQNESLLFPAHTAWEWVEAYGAVEMDPGKVHGAYRESRVNVEKWLDEHLPERDLDDFLMRTKKDAVKGTTTAFYGEPWGTLDDEIKVSLGGKRTASYLDFGPVGKEQELWQRLLQTGKFDEPAPEEAPASFMVQDEWFELLKKCVKERDQENWYAWYHLGLSWFAREDYERAENCFRKSLELQESTWAFHGLANVAEAQGEREEASRYMREALLRNSENVTITKQAIRAAFLAEDYGLVEEIFDRGKKLWPEDGLLWCYHAMALAHTGELEEAKEIFETWGGEKVVDRREAADAITDEYIYTLRELAKKEGHPCGEDEEAEVPCHIDYRMYYTRMVK